MSTERKTWSVDLLNGPIMKNLVIFMIPILVSYVFQQLYNTVDTAIVGHYLGEQSLASVGASVAVFDLMVGFAQGLGNGVCIVVSRAYGAGDGKELRKAVAGSLVIGAATIAVMTLLSLLGLGPLLRILGTPDVIYNEALSYIRIIGGFIFVMFTYNLLSSLLRAIGNSAMALVFLIFSSVLNVFLDILLVAGTDLGVRGAAYATVIAQGISAFLCIVYVNRNIRELRFSWHTLRINGALAKRTLSYGGFTALQQCAQPIGNLIIQGTINTLGVSAAAAFSAARKIEDIGLLPGRSISSAMTALIAQNRGARDTERVEQGFHKGMLLEAGSGLLVCAVVLLLRTPLMSLFTVDTAIIRAGVTYFNVIGFCYWLPCLTNGMQGYLRGVGAMKTSLFATLTQISFRVASTLLLVPHMGISGVALACIIGWSAMLAWTLPWRLHLKKINE